ncbi:hypothetical protein [Zunongwangia atlantica]|uniref:Uncharacterized protein n=1 Tax=Zunongwangia atlantica 22II14-10F7 TaxID=1185767 RepID=A0A1Y1SXM2_9FLAO|nr:hypothetical protein [Zunongwangia atlantica]ORL43490.1 hypothetical protein IIF7_20554 [Zunongwangia atlantica 22II14-10F7]
MKNLLLFLIFSTTTYAQNISKINADLNLSDSLSKNEIRIYEGVGITNYSSIFRMYKTKSENWIAEFYKHYAEVQGQAELHTEKRVIESNNDMEYVWKSILRTNIQYLPSMPEIKYKMKERGNVELIDGEYQITWNSKEIMDGVGYEVQIKNNKFFNQVEYGNPESYLKHYPNIDELIFFKELLNLLRNEFNIWLK